MNEIEDIRGMLAYAREHAEIDPEIYTALCNAIPDLLDQVDMMRAALAKAADDLDSARQMVESWG